MNSGLTLFRTRDSLCVNKLSPCLFWTSGETVKSSSISASGATDLIPIFSSMNCWICEGVSEAVTNQVPHLLWKERTRPVGANLFISSKIRLAWASSPQETGKGQIIWAVATAHDLDYDGAEEMVRDWTGWRHVDHSPRHYWDCIPYLDWQRSATQYPVDSLFLASRLPADYLGLSSEWASLGLGLSLAPRTVEYLLLEESSLLMKTWKVTDRKSDTAINCALSFSRCN